MLYMVLLAWLALVVFWGHQMNFALKHFDSSFVVPVLTVLWTLLVGVFTHIQTAHMCTRARTHVGAHARTRDSTHMRRAS